MSFIVSMPPDNRYFDEISATFSDFSIHAYNKGEFTQMVSGLNPKPKGLRVHAYIAPETFSPIWCGMSQEVFFFFLPILGVFGLKENFMGFKLKIIFCEKTSFNGLILCTFHLYSHICYFWSKTQIYSYVNSRGNWDQAWCGIQVCFWKKKRVVDVRRHKTSDQGKNWRLGLGPCIYLIFLIADVFYHF